MHGVRTFGHGTLDADTLAEVLVSAAVELVVDVRRFPGSRRHPHVNRVELESWLPRHDLDYQWIEALGGRRPVDPGSVHVALRNEQFRAYADHMATDDFAAGVQELLQVAADHPVAVMCSESVWWRCHRRLLADHLVLVEGVTVEHLFHDGRISAHAPASEARVEDGRLVYDVGGQAELFEPGGR